LPYKDNFFSINEDISAHNSPFLLRRKVQTLDHQQQTNPGKYEMATACLSINVY
jgi:hypothetical protein